MRKKISILLFVTGMVLIALVCLQYYNVNNVYKTLKKETVAEETIKNKSKKKKVINWSKLKSINENIVAWLYIPGTGVDYPVIKATDNDFYLSHDMYGKNSIYGSIYLDARYYNMENINDVDNIIIYGHNMGHWNTSMFGKLMKYKEQDYYSKHKDIYLYTPTENSTYKVVDVVRTTVSNKWYQFTTLSGSELSLDELKNCLDKDALYQCKQLKESSNKFITLSTCDYDGNYRILVVGERIS
ncbi:MAG: class B sortase [Eubacterium ventriosum]|uniref:class B sortase n=1 Tax=Eubacterium ventriosum TaxID=39496 RepID=UPI001D410E38|nr:class B sortase [Eubacterium ventriosum]MBD9054410.1 class B sortase [Eubacterium ventriosum]